MRRWLVRLRAAFRRRAEADPAAILDLHRTLAAVRFQPRASLGPELYGRARRGERPPAPGLGWGRRLGWGAAGTALLGAVAWLALRPDAPVGGGHLDRCCFDLDGGGPADDGLVILARQGETIASAFIYEDADGSRTFTPGDVIRLGPGIHRETTDPVRPGLVPLDYCCWDLDGGGREDDGIVVVSAPPDRVLLAAIYEDRPGTRAASHGAVLRYVLR